MGWKDVSEGWNQFINYVVHEFYLVLHTQNKAQLFEVFISLVNFAGLEENNLDKIKCQEHFDIYKECKKKEVLTLLDT